MLEQIAANPLTRFAVAAGSPVMGAGEWLPGAAGQWFAENNAEMKRLVEAGKASQDSVTQGIGTVADVAGTILSPAYLGLGKVLPAAKTLAGLATQGAVTGAIGGATQPTGSADIGDKLQTTGASAALGGIVSPIVGSVFKGMYNIFAPSFSKSAVDQSAARLAVKTAGDRADDVAAALRNSVGNETAAQTALPAGSSELSALQKLVSGYKGTEFGNVKRIQAQQALDELSSVTPNLPSAEKAVKLADAQNYANAFAQKVKANPTLAQLASNPFFKQAQQESSDLIGAKGITFMQRPVEYLHNVKLGLDKMLSRKGDTALGDAERREVAQLKNRLMSWMEQNVPNQAYEIARKEHARLMQPVNQANVLGKMQGVLEGPGGTERSAPFLNAIGRGEEALLKKSTGFPRFEAGDLQKVLTPEQYGVVTGIAKRLDSNAELSQREIEGMSAALRAIRASENKTVKLPALVDAKIAFINRMLNALEGIGGARTQERLAELMLPNNQRMLSGLMKEQINNPKGWLADSIRYQGGAIGYPSGMLTGEKQ